MGNATPGVAPSWARRIGTQPAVICEQLNWEDIPVNLEGRFEAELLKLRKLRDELKLQLHLGSSDLKDRYEELEGKWHTFERRVAAAREVAREETQEVSEATKLLLGEIRDGYRHIRDSLQ
jgi:hypothetical protein